MIKSFSDDYNKSSAECFVIITLGFRVTSSYSKIKKITFPSEVSVPSDKRPYRTLTFHNVLARQGSSFYNRARLNSQAFALRDTKVAAQEGCRISQTMSYRYRLFFAN